MVAPRTVLVVDDEQTLRDILAEALTFDGFDVKTAANGAQALAMLACWRPHVIVLDLNMPLMDGRAFRRAQLSQPEMADIPVIVCSAAHRGDAKITDLSVAAFLPKPFDFDELTRLVGLVGQK